MKIRIARVMLAAALALSAGGSFAVEPPPSAAWMTHCAGNLATRHLPPPAVQAYCFCMAGLSDEVEMLAMDQGKLQKSFPYMHPRCVDQAAKHKDDTK